MFNQPITGSNFNSKLLKGLFLTALFLLLTALAMYLWNAVLTPVTHVAAIDYRQALGLMILCRILFGGIPGSGGMLWNGRGNTIKNKLMNMNETDRAAFKDEWRKRCERRKKS